MKNLFKRTKGIIVILLLMSVFLSDGYVVASAADVSLNKTNVYIQKGKSYSLKIKGTSNKVSWSSSNKKVATVSKEGKVTAVAPGKAKVTAKVLGKKYSASVVVVNAINANDFKVKVKDFPKKGKTYKIDFIPDQIENSNYVLWIDYTLSFNASRGIKNGSTMKQVEKAFGTVSAKDYQIEEPVNSFMERNEVRTGKWKKYLEYKCTNKKVEYRLRFYLGSNNKVNGMVLVKNYNEILG